MSTPETATLLEVKVTQESFHDWRLALASLREKKGMEEVSLRLADGLIKAAVELGLHDDVLQLMGEKFLSYQHKVMNQDSLPESQRDIAARREAIEMMSETARTIAKYVDENGLEGEKPRSYRNAGRASDYMGDYQTAIEYYKKAIAIYDPQENQMVRSNRLEILGFLAFSQIMSGDIKGGVELAEQTFDRFNNSEEGLDRKEADYYTWAVWASGIPIRTVSALLLTKALPADKKMWAEEWLRKAEAMMAFPDGSDTWGDKNFEYRKNELKKVREGLASI
jgi:tetratricopeptide (TPR) repeat protein